MEGYGGVEWERPLYNCMMLDSVLPPVLPPRAMHTVILPPNPAGILFALVLRTGINNNLPATLLLSSPFFSSPLLPFPLNSVLSAFARSSFPSLALRTLSLIHRLSLPLDSYSLCSSLSAASAPSHGPQLHAAASKTGCLSNIYTCGALISFYARAASLEDAHRLFDETPLRNTVCANSLLSGYAEGGLWVRGLSLVRSMPALGLRPDELTISCLLKICSDAAMVEFGRQAHAYSLRASLGTVNDTVLSSCLVEMYGKCGLAGKARSAFETASRGERGRDVVLWTSMLNAYGRNGQLDNAIRAFDEMRAEKTEPDGVVFLAILSACGRSGNVEKGLEFLELMGRNYGLVPGPEHYGCVIDMLCRAGELEEAFKFANGNGKRVGISSWGAILSACRDSGNVETGKAAARKGLELDPGNVGIFTELSNLYAKVGMWDEIGELREKMKDKGLKKDSGCSWLECANCFA